MDVNIGVRLSLGNLKGAAGQISGILRGEARKVEASNRSAGKSFVSIEQGARKAGLSMQQIGTAAAHANSTVSSTTGKSTSLLNRLGGTASGVTSAIHRIGGASGSVGKVGDAASATAKKLDTAGNAGARAGSNISKGMSGAASSVNDLSGVIGGVIAGFGAVEIGQAMWTGAMDKQFNQAYLAMHKGTDQAKILTSEIQNIVAAVPGDDTFMNTLLVDAAVMGASIDNMRSLAVVAADYSAAAAKTGMTQIEAQQDLNAYILTGNTAELQRSRILGGQLDKLEGKKTVEERIAALQDALEAKNLAGLSTLDVAKIKWEAIKGRIQMAATSLGEKFLPYIEAAFDWFISIDEATGGLVGQLTIAGGLAIALAGSLGLISGPIKTGIGLFRDMGGSITGAGSRVKDLISSFRTGGITGIIDKFENLFRGKKKLNVDCASSTCGGYLDIFGGKGKSKTSKTAGAAGTAGAAEGIISSILASSLTGPLIAVAAGLVTTVVLDTVMDDMNQKIVQQAPPQYKEVIREILPQPDPRPKEIQQAPPDQKAQQFTTSYGIPNSNWVANLGLGTLLNGPIDFNTVRKITSGQLPFDLATNRPGTSTPTVGLPSFGGWNIMDWFTSGGKKMSPFDWFKGMLNPFEGFNLGKSPTENKAALESWIGRYGSGDWLGDLGKISWNPLDWFLPKPVSGAGAGGKPNFQEDIDSIIQRGFGKGSWFDTSTWKLPEIKLPEFKWPEINWQSWLPEISLPEWGWPEFTWPNIQLPDWDWPRFDWPKVELPKWKWPNFKWPNIKLPQWRWPNFRWPNVKLPAWRWPAFRWPSVKLPQWRWPSFKWPSLPGFRWPSLPSFHWPSVNFDLIGYIKSKIPPFRWPWGPGYLGSIKNFGSMVKQHGIGITGTVGTVHAPPGWRPSRSILDVVGFRGPRGPAGPLEEFDRAANILIQPGMYQGYPGSRGDPIGSLVNGGNCFDMSLGLMSLAGGKGLSTELIWGTWNDESHVWPKIGGRDYDPARKALNNTWTPPPQGPGGYYAKEREIHLHFHDKVYGMNDFEKQVEKAVDEVIR